MKQITAEGNSFPKMSILGPYTFFSLLLLTLFLPSLSWPNLLQKGKTFQLLDLSSETQIYSRCWRFSICSLASKGSINGLTLFCKAFRKDPLRLEWFLAECLLLILFCTIILKLCTCFLSNLCRNNVSNGVMLVQRFRMISSPWYVPQMGNMSEFLLPFFVTQMQLQRLQTCVLPLPHGTWQPEYVPPDTKGWNQ